MWKRLVLGVRRLIKSLFRGLGFKLSILLLVFSAAVSMMILIPDFFDRVPVYSYFISRLELPMAYELTGEVKIMDKDNNIVNKDVEIFIGGYVATADSNGMFHLIFSAPKTSEVYVTIRYTKPDGQIETIINLLSPKDNEHKLEERFIIYV